MNSTQIVLTFDDPEGGLEALVQAMVCKQHIGWRDQVRRLVVFATDANSHLAGNGRVRKRSLKSEQFSPVVSFEPAGGNFEPERRPVPFGLEGALRPRPGAGLPVAGAGEPLGEAERHQHDLRRDGRGGPHVRGVQPARALRRRRRRRLERLQPGRHHRQQIRGALQSTRLTSFVLTTK